METGNEKRDFDERPGAQSSKNQKTNFRLGSVLKLESGAGNAFSTSVPFLEDWVSRYSFLGNGNGKQEVGSGKWKT
jgi:hypothetical protein